MGDVAHGRIGGEVGGASFHLDRELRPDCVGDFIQGRSIAGHQPEVAAFGRQRFGDGPADAFRSAGYQDALAG
jgi:hypothetical protein